MSEGKGDYTMDDMTLREMRNKEYQRKYGMEMRRRWSEAGLCITCGKNAPEIGFKVCTECLTKQSKQARARRRARQNASKPVPEDKAWIVSDKTCRGCQYFGYLSGTGGTKACNYTLLTGRVRHEPCATCEVKTTGRRLRRAVTLPAPNGDWVKELNTRK